jgi:hypothetical protein
MLTSYLKQKRRKRAKTIKHLQLIKDPLIKKFNLKQIMESNLYHSPEESETDSEAEKNKIVVKDLKWRSSTVSISFSPLLFNLVLTIFN